MPNVEVEGMPWDNSFAAYVYFRLSDDDQNEFDSMIQTGNAAEVAAVLSRGLGVAIEPELTEWYRAGDVRHCFADTSRAHQLLGFRAGVTLEEGMGELVEWLAQKLPAK